MAVEPFAYTRTLIDMVHQPLAVLDRELRVRHANAAFTALGDVIDEDLCAVLAGVAAGGDLVRGMEIERGERMLSVDARRMPDELGGILLAIEDITEKRATEHALRHHEYLIAAITDIVFSLDTSWRIQTWNPAAERYLGYTAAEAIGKRSEEVIHVDESVDRAAARERLMRGEVFRNETRIRTKSGDWIEVEASTVPVRNKDGNAIGFVAIMHDIAETKQLERQLREHARVVEEANRELDSFTYSVSHDLRAPLRAIDGFSRILVEDHGATMTKDELRIANVIRKNTQQMGQLIDDLLAFARLGRKELVVTTVDMKALLIELVPEVLEGTEYRVIDLKAGFVPPAVGDRALLKQVWLNLLSNAVKYTKHRERAVINVSGEVTHGEIVYKVEDNGAGFDMQYVGKLFGVFQRLHRNTEFEGTGVGLALVQRIVRRHGGRVWAEGKPDVGATFWFALPRGGTNG